MTNDNCALDRSPAWLAGGGRMGEMIRSANWEGSPLGPIDSWPSSLKSAVSICIGSDLPMAIAWGPHCVQIYNDAYLSVTASRHPDSLGLDFRRCWSSVWPVIGEAFNEALAGRPQKIENARMFIDRNGYPEEVFFTCFYSPIRDESGAVAGVFHPLLENTGCMLATRRARLVRDIALQCVGAETGQETLIRTAGVLSGYDTDFPFALFYLFDEDHAQATLAAAAGVQPGMNFSPESIDRASGAPAWPLFDLRHEPGSAVMIADIEQRFGAISCGPYPEPPNAAMLLPITLPGAKLPVGACVLGLSSRLPSDDAYRDLCSEVAEAIGLALTGVSSASAESDPDDRLPSLRHGGIDRSACDALAISEERPRRGVCADTPERVSGTVRDAALRLNLETSLRRQTDILQMILNGMPEGVIVCDAGADLILVNKSAEEMLCLDGGVSDLAGLAGAYEWLLADGQTQCAFDDRPLVRALKGERIAEFELVIRCQARRINLAINGSSTPLTDVDGKIIGAVKVFRDVTASMSAMQDLRSAEQHFKLLVEGTTDYAIFMLDAEGLIVSWNPGAQRILGYEEKEVVGRHVSIFYTPEDIARGEPQRKLNQTVLEGRAEEDSWRMRKDGQRFWSTGVLDALHDENGGVRGFVEIMRDNTERRLAEENTYFLANHDPLTGLANRARFMERLHEALLGADRDDTQVAVLLLDLDRFKLINDTMGHHVGDMLLKKVATRLSKCVRETDTVARLGGDEFVLILTRLRDIGSVEILAGKIIQEMSRPYHINRQEVRSGTSLGVAIYRRDGHDAGELLQKADLAMYRAKASGRNRYQVFAASMLTEMRIRSEQENSLRHALEHQEFELSFQPQIDLKTLRLSGAEVLLRTRNRVLQGIDPGRVIALAEETGLIVPLGEWILQAACRQMKKWQKMGLPDFRIAVNFSPLHLLEPNFIDTVRRVLNDTGLEARYLEIEVTEGLLVAASQANNEIMSSLKELGVSISVDDFGTGYSALSYLKNFPVDVLKIDESLVRNLPADQDDVAIVSAITRLAMDLNIRVVAEGVETVEQLAHLKTIDCNTAQGYLFSPAVRTEQFETLLHGRKWMTPILH